PPPSSPLLFASFLLLSRRPPTSTLFPYTTLFRSRRRHPRALHLRPARRSRRALRRRHPSPRSFRPGLRPPATSLFRKTPPTPGGVFLRPQHAPSDSLRLRKFVSQVRLQPTFATKSAKDA